MNLLLEAGLRLAEQQARKRSDASSCKGMTAMDSTVNSPSPSVASSAAVPPPPPSSSSSTTTSTKSKQMPVYLPSLLKLTVNRSISLPAMARFILCNNEKLLFGQADCAVAFFRPGKMFEKGDRSLTRRAYDVCHVLENIGVVRRARFNNKKGYFWLGLKNIPKYLRDNFIAPVYEESMHQPEKTDKTPGTLLHTPQPSSASKSSSSSKKTIRRDDKLKPIQNDEYSPYSNSAISSPTLSLLTKAYLTSVFNRKEVSVSLSPKRILQRIMKDQEGGRAGHSQIPSSPKHSKPISLTKRQVQRRIYDVLGVLQVAGVVTKKSAPKGYAVCSAMLLGRNNGGGLTVAHATKIHNRCQKAQALLAGDTSFRNHNKRKSIGSAEPQSKRRKQLNS